MSDALEGASVQARARARGGRWGAPVTCLASTGSTQDDAKQAASAGAPEGTAFVAEQQAAGRGRQGRVWVAPPGSSLLASVVLRPRLSPQALPPLSLVVGLSVLDAVGERLGPGKAAIKWPNDVVVGARKLSGVLVEASIRGDRVESVVAGFGINVRRAALPPELSARAVSLEEAGASGEGLARSPLLGDVLASLERRVERFVAEGLGCFLEELRAADGARGRRVRGSGFEGEARQIEPDGRLLVETAAGPVRVAAGEIEFLLGPHPPAPSPSPSRRRRGAKPCCPAAALPLCRGAGRGEGAGG